MKFIGYADGTESNPDGTRMSQGSETFLFDGKVWEGWRLMEMGLMQSASGNSYHPIEGWFNK